MQESKIELTERLRRDGRWSEASKRKDEIVQQLRAEGMTRNAAGEEAWRRTGDEFPPLLSTADPKVEPERLDAAEEQRVVGPTVLPVAWGELPDSAGFAAEVEWVHQNRVLVVEDRPAGKSILHWDRARKPAPSYGAVNLMEYAATNLKGFMDILQKVVKLNGDSDSANVRKEKMKTDDIKALLESLQDDMDAQLRADVPGVLQQRVHEMLSDWGQRCGVSLATDTRSRLDLAIVDLLRDSLRAFVPIANLKETHG